MTLIESAPVIQHAIQLAIAPVFLLTGIASLLGVMANRLARIIDRSRDLEERWPTYTEGALASAVDELVNLERRRKLASWAINFCTSAALLVCSVISVLFIEEFLTTDLKWLAGILFICVMAALVAGLCLFLREVYIATHTVRIDPTRYVR
jgi:hypothetical protein